MMPAHSMQLRDATAIRAAARASREKASVVAVQHLERWIDLAAHLLTLPAEHDPMVDVCATASAQFGDAAVGIVETGPTVSRIARYRAPHLDAAYYARAVPRHPLSRHYAATNDPHVRCLADARRFHDEPGARELLAHARGDGFVDALFVPLAHAPGMSHRWLCLGTTERLGRAACDVLETLRPLLRAIDAQSLVLGGARPHPEAAAAARAAHLTGRELSVLALTARGLTAVAIGDRLSISSRTVSLHQQHAYAKLGVHDRLSAVMIAHERGILPRARVRTPAPGVEVIEHRLAAAAPARQHPPTPTPTRERVMSS
jgi:DNA-binding CsgD family transcriptional regulator